MGLVSELKRRNVFRMMALYIVAAWLIMQVAEVVIGLANLPDWVGLSILVLLVTGLPIALVLSWFYELTPEGISLDKEKGGGRPVAGRRVDFVVISLLCAALLLFAYDKWAVGPPPELSIAVLPFKTAGTEDDERSGFLAQGIQDDLLTRLSGVSAMKVISRTSVERYRNTDKDIPTIAAELGVSKVLEGGVQTFGDKVRVNVQLIDAAADEHVWAATYDRALTASDIFAIQSEIVETIARQTHTSLTPSESRQLVSLPTTNMAAYTAYLQGRQRADVETVESLHEAVELFQQAVALDPDFSLAYIRLADAYLTLGANFWGGLSAEESAAMAEPFIAKALSLNQNLGEAHAMLGLLRQQQGDTEAAELAYQEAITLRPNYSRAYHLYGRLIWRRLGNRQGAMELLQKALSIDPYSAPVNYEVGRLYDALGEFEEALARYLQIIEIEPDHAFAYVYIAAMHYLVDGRIDEALVWYDKAARNDAMSPSLQAAPALAYLEIGDPVTAKMWVDKARVIGPDTFWAIWASLLHSVYVANDAAIQRDARNMLEHYPRNWGALNVLCNADIAAGRYDIARARFARTFPELVEPELPQVNEYNYGIAVDLAHIYRLLGEEEKADDLLRASLNLIENLPRLGVAGHYITDVRIYAIQNRREQALAALRQAVGEGWRFLIWYYLELDRSLDSIRDTPEFERIYAELRKDLDRQAERVRELRESGELVASPGQLRDRPAVPEARLVP